MARTRITKQQQNQSAKRIPALTTARTFGSRSPLVDPNFKVDLQAFLAKCMSTSQWEKYSEKEREGIISSLPTTRQVNIAGFRRSSQREGSTPDNAIHLDGDCIEQITQKYATPPLTPSFCSDDAYLKRHVARFRRDLADGYYEKAWQEKAKRAHEERMAGKFDDYLGEHAAEMFIEEGEEGDRVDELAEESEDGGYQIESRKKGGNGTAKRKT